MTVKAKCIRANADRTIAGDKPVVRETVEFHILPDASTPGVAGGNCVLVFNEESAVGKYKHGQVYDLTV